MTTTTQPYHPQTIEDKILSFFDVKREDVHIPTRGKDEICFVRQVIMYCLYRFTEMDKSAISRYMGRNHTQTGHSIKVIYLRCETEPDTRNKIIEIEKLFE